MLWRGNEQWGTRGTPWCRVLASPPEATQSQRGTLLLVAGDQGLVTSQQLEAGEEGSFTSGDPSPVRDGRLGGQGRRISLDSRFAFCMC